jgi:hypothetical protein
LMWAAAGAWSSAAMKLSLIRLLFNMPHALRAIAQN